MKTHLFLAAAAAADAEERITLPPTRTVVMVGLVAASIALVGRRPLIAGGLALATVLFAGFAAILHGTPGVFETPQDPITRDTVVMGFLLLPGGVRALPTIQAFFRDHPTHEENSRCGAYPAHQGPCGPRECGGTDLADG